MKGSTSKDCTNLDMTQDTVAASNFLKQIQLLVYLSTLLSQKHFAFDQKAIFFIGKTKWES